MTKKEFLKKFKSLKCDVEKDESGRWYRIYGFVNPKDSLMVDKNSITMVNLDYNGDDVWEVIHWLQDEFNLKLN